MSRLQRFAHASASQLLRHILERPELVAAVRELPPEVLSQLIDRVGLEDSGELVALATPAQLEALFDTDLWHSEAPGREERFAAQRFALWLAVMSEAGETFLIRNLVQLPVDTLTLAVHRLALVLDMDALMEGVSAYDEDMASAEKLLESSLSEEWEEFRLIARDPGLWDELWSALMALDRDHHELLRTVLEQCAAMNREQIEEEGLYEVLSAEDSLEDSVLGERDDRRAAQGYVSPSDAHSFLQLARSETELPEQRDPITRAYFRTLEQRPRDLTVTHATSASANGLLQLVAAATEQTSPPQKNRRPEPVAARSQPKAQLTRASGDASVTPPVQTDLLTSALAELAQHHAQLHDLRTEELGYLANVLVAGLPHAGRRFRAAEALEAALATCSLGLVSWPQQAAAGSQLSAAATCLQAITCDRLFRLGFRNLQRELVLPARQLLVSRCAALGDGKQHAEARKLAQSDGVFGLLERYDASELGLLAGEYEAVVALAEALPWFAGELAASAGVGAWCAGEADLERARALIVGLRAQR